jgi:glyoxylase-like metal-dependent hydrolase (beta-lactamase superfamily II)
VAVVLERFPELGITRVSRWCFNCYVITGDDGALIVVDAGIPVLADDLEPVVAGMPGVVKTVTATHGHCDHVGGAAALAERHNADIYLSVNTMRYFDAEKPRTPSVFKMARCWPLLFGQRFDAKAAWGFVRASLSAGFGTWRGMLWHGVHPIGGLEDGVPLPGAAAWTVLNRPGHTDDSIALWNDNSATLLCGDAAFTTKGRVRFAPDTIDAAAAAQTVARVQTLPVEHLFPGHGLPVHGPSIWESALALDAVWRDRK